MHSRALIGVALAILAAPAHAAQLVQTRTFDVSHILDIRSDYQNVQYRSSPLVFDGFDGALGTLNKVTWNLSGVQTSEYFIQTPYSVQTRGRAFGETTVQLSSLNFGTDPLFFSPMSLQCQQTGSRCTAQDSITHGMGRHDALTGADALDYMDQSSITAFLTATLRGSGFAQIVLLCGVGFELCLRTVELEDAYLSYSAKGVMTLTYDYDARTVGVPEPGTWALMIGGFGLAGATLRRRSAAAVA